MNVIPLCSDPLFSAFDFLSKSDMLSSSTASPLFVSLSWCCSAVSKLLLVPGAVVGLQFG
jgi:hypothetical protein